MTTTQKTIIDTAKSYLHKKEITPNKGFEDFKFQGEMASVGWYVNAPWCAFFVKLVWRKSGIDTKKINGSAVQSYKNLDKSEMFEKSTIPIPGALVFWRSYRNGKPLSTGHAGVVVDVNIVKTKKVGNIEVPIEGSFTAIEGNTNDKGGREGIMVAQKIRHFKWEATEGTRLLGFINPTI